MKRTFIFTAVAVLLAASCSPVKIFMDSTSADGARKLVTTQETIKRNGHGGTLGISMGASIKDADTVVAVLAVIDADTGHGVFNAGDAMKFRLADGQEITLTNLLDKKFQHNTETTVSEQWETGYGVAYAYGVRRCFVRPYSVTYLTPEVSTTTTNNSYALYLVTRQQLWDIVHKGVVKLRVETENYDIDLEKGDAEPISGILKSQILCLRERIFQQKVEKEF